MDQGGDDGFGVEAGGGEHFPVFGGAVGSAFGQGEEGGGVEGEGEWAAKVVAQEDVVDDELAARGEGGGAAVDELLALWDVPVVEDVGEEDEVAVLRQSVGEHVAGEEFEAVGDAVVVAHFEGDLEDFGAVEDDGLEMLVALEEGDGVDAGAAADVEDLADVFIDRQFRGEDGGDVLGAAGEGEGEPAGAGFGLHGGLDALAVDEGGAAGAGLGAGGSVGAEAFDHFEDAGVVGGEADVVADVEGPAGGEVLAGEGREVEVAANVGEEEAHGAEGGDEDVGGALVEAEAATELVEGERAVG